MLADYEDEMKNSIETWDEMLEERNQKPSIKNNFKKKKFNYQKIRRQIN
jgi:hypothetical protein